MMKGMVTVAAVFAVIMLGPPAAHAAEAPSFTMQGTPITAPGTGQCWQATGAWHRDNVLGFRMYGWGFDIVWCANQAGTVVASVPSHTCYRSGGGSWQYHGCTRTRSAVGYGSVHLVDEWAFSMNLHVTTVWAYPSVDFRVYPSGRIEGTVYDR